MESGCKACFDVISVKVAALMEGVLKTMLITKLKIMAAAILLSGTVITCGVLAAAILAPGAANSTCGPRDASGKTRDAPSTAVTPTTPG